MLKNELSRGARRAPYYFRVVISGLLAATISASPLSSSLAQSSSPSETQTADYDWPTYANDPGSSKYAPLDQIDAKNVEQLQVAWVWDSVDNELTKKLNRVRSLGFKSTPIKIGDSLYLSTSLGNVVSLDAATGKQRWVFDTKTYEDGRPANLGFNHRGVAFWADGDKQRILMGTNNGYLWSIDAKTGSPDLAFGNQGKVDLTKGLGREVARRMYSVVAPPVVFKNTVILGSVVSDAPLAGWAPSSRDAMPPGHVRGFDIRTGKQKWIFHSIPQEGETGNDTWQEDSWKDTGSTNVWTMMSVDPELGYVYLPFGTPGNDWYGGQRPGDNLFGESLVCLNAQTGELVWHFQMIHHGLWDYDLPAAPNLVDITVDGKPIKAVAQISKQGFVYVFDRATGKPVWPIEERAVPQSKVPGEHTAATQPFPTKPGPFEYQGITDDVLINFTPELHAEAKKIVNQYDHGPLFTPPSLRGSIQLPGDGGGGEWSGAAFDPESSMFYIPSMNRAIIVQLVEMENNDAWDYVRGGTTGIRGPKNMPITKPPYGKISALNLDTGEYDWAVPNGDGMRQMLIDMGIKDPGPVGSPGIFPPLLTKSLLFVSNASWGRNAGRYLQAYDKETGKLVHRVSLPGSPNGAPMTYMAGGKQYISIAVGGSTDAKLVTLSLP